MTRASAAAVALAAILLMGAGDDPAERLPDPAKEAQARHLFRQLRCVVCQNESVDDSEAGLARDLRRIVRQQVAAGRSDAEIRAYLTDRYGEFILLTPTRSPANLALWLTPPILLLAAGLALFLQTRKPKRFDEPLSDAEEMELAKVLTDGGSATVPPHNGPRKGPSDDGKIT